MGVVRSRMVVLSSVMFFTLSCMPLSSTAADFIDQSANLFIFQQKLAAKGISQAQYRLAFMYETGQGVKANQTKAMQWYAAAAKQGNRSAGYRLAYLQAKRDGYNKAKNAKWVGDVKKAAAAGKPEEVFLLAQLYHEGIGVKKDLHKSLKLMYRLSDEGMVAVDREIASLQAEIKANKVSRRSKRTIPVKPPIKTVSAAQKQVKVAEKAVAAAGKAKSVKQLEREKYKAVMQKIAKQQAEIDSLQGWTEGKKKASVDDEF